MVLSTRPHDAIGSAHAWERATTALTEALDRKGWAFEVDEGGAPPVLSQSTRFAGPFEDLLLPRERL